MLNANRMETEYRFELARPRGSTQALRATLAFKRPPRFSDRHSSSSGSKGKTSQHAKGGHPSPFGNFETALAFPQIVAKANPGDH
jgi:hypothetical protein